MKPGDSTYTIEWLMAGQPRPYADHIYQFKISVTWMPYSGIKLEPRPLCYELIEKAARAIGRDWSKKEPEKREWHETYLKSAVKIGPGSYEFTVIEPFTD